MISPIFDSTTFLVFFIYGLAFLGMGVALALEAGRSPSLAEARLLWPLAAFGVLHGMHEWVEFFTLQATWMGMHVPSQIAVFRLTLLTLSFLALLLYGVQAFHLPPGNSRTWVYMGIGALAAYMVTISVSAIISGEGQNTTHWVSVSDALVRYLLAVPGSLLAALGLRFQALNARTDFRRPIAANLNWAAIGFALYSLTQLIAPPVEMVPATLLNTQIFYEATGVHHEVVRSVLAILVTLNLLRATQVLEQERRERMIAAQQARLEALEQRDAMRRELLRHTVRAQEEERARIARELHDETAQILSAFSLELAALGDGLHKNPRLRQRVERLQELSRRMSQGLYRLVHDLRPSHLDDLGLLPALEYLLEQDCCPKGLDVQLQVEGQPRRLDPLIETVLFRVAQEALYNVVRHAGRCHSRVRLSFEKERVVLQVTDDGKGFDPNERFEPPRGWGLMSMRERVDAVDGQFILRSAPGKGTRVEAVIPLNSFGDGKEHGDGHDSRDAGG
ncbi:MAG: sensor histidine kinase [Anaerolineae bacterium]|nr:MAG: sensor histidine kinase [Anaerolineae bacterium]